MLGLRRRGRFGLLYIDGHADYWQPERNPIDGAASASDLAFVTGRGPAVLTELEGRAPVVEPRDVVVFGNRDRAERSEGGCQPLPDEMGVIGRDRDRTLGVDAAMAEALSQLRRPDRRQRPRPRHDRQHRPLRVHLRVKRVEFAVSAA